MGNTILVVAEPGDGGPRPVSLELISAAKRVAEASGSTVTALLMGAELSSVAEQMARAGVDRLMVADDERLRHLSPQALAAVLARVVEDLSPFAVIVPCTTAGIEYAPRVAARLGLPIASDVVDLAVEDGRLVAVRPVMGGRVMTAVRFEGDGPVMVSVRQGSFEKAIVGSGGPTPEPVAVELTDADLRLNVTGVAAKESAGKGLDTADVIVGGGRGLKEAANFALVEQLAFALHGAVAATRAITDAGWRPHNEQIGQTGRVVSPRLYIAVGISGAAQHVAGLQGAEHIVAINRDPDAPIFKISSFGIVGDLFEVVPAILAELKASA
ncbi:MAG: electron transfer flavoprotein subunit alpha/FixB family protein [Thermomicrobiales bacterium]|nr:electron transfer flavoprotein subunit alpha/FixB family protein [Thermomicrobiales bacterium]